MRFKRHQIIFPYSSLCCKIIPFSIIFFPGKMKSWNVDSRACVSLISLNLYNLLFLFQYTTVWTTLKLSIWNDKFILPIPIAFKEKPLASISCLSSPPFQKAILFCNINAMVLQSKGVLPNVLIGAEHYEEFSSLSVSD